MAENFTSNSKLIIESKDGQVQLSLSCDLGNLRKNNFFPFNYPKKKRKSKKRRYKDNIRAKFHRLSQLKKLLSNEAVAVSDVEGSDTVEGVSFSTEPDKTDAVLTGKWNDRSETISPIWNVTVYNIYEAKNKQHSCWHKQYDKCQFMFNDIMMTARDIMSTKVWHVEHKNCTDSDCLLKLPNFLCCRAQHILKEDEEEEK